MAADNHTTIVGNLVEDPELDQPLDLGRCRAGEVGEP